jgi:hypothetical protein
MRILEFRVEVKLEQRGGKSEVGKRGGATNYLRSYRYGKPRARCVLPREARLSKNSHTFFPVSNLLFIFDHPPI